MKARKILSEVAEEVLRRCYCMQMNQEEEEVGEEALMYCPSFLMAPVKEAEGRRLQMSG